MSQWIIAFFSVAGAFFLCGLAVHLSRVPLASGSSRWLVSALPSPLYQLHIYLYQNLEMNHALSYLWWVRLRLGLFSSLRTILKITRN